MSFQKFCFFGQIILFQNKRSRNKINFQVNSGVCNDYGGGSNDDLHGDGINNATNKLVVLV